MLSQLQCFRQCMLLGLRFVALCSRFVVLHSRLVVLQPRLVVLQARLVFAAETCVLQHLSFCSQTCRSALKTCHSQARSVLARCFFLWLNVARNRLEQQNLRNYVRVLTGSAFVFRKIRASKVSRSGPKFCHLRASDSLRKLCTSQGTRPKTRTLKPLQSKTSEAQQT